MLYSLCVRQHELRETQHWQGRKARSRRPSGLVEFKTDAVYPVRGDANGAGVGLRQLQDQEHRAGDAK